MTNRAVEMNSYCFFGVTLYVNNNISCHYTRNVRYSYCAISPGMTPELEIILAEGAGMEPGYSSDKVSMPPSPSTSSPLLAFY